MKKRLFQIGLFLFAVLMAFNLSANNDIAYGNVTKLELQFVDPPETPEFPWQIPPIPQFEVVEIPASGYTLNLYVQEPESGNWIFIAYSTTDSYGHYSFDLRHIYDYNFFALLNHYDELNFRITDCSGGTVYVPDFTWSPRHPVYEFNFCIGF